jgi:NAD(P)H-flavin reductase
MPCGRVESTSSSWRAATVERVIEETAGRLELRGPVGPHFIWRAEDGGPLVLIASRTGLALVMAMLRHRPVPSSIVETQLLVSARSPEAVLYRDELAC